MNEPTKRFGIGQTVKVVSDKHDVCGDIIGKVFRIDMADFRSGFWIYWEFNNGQGVYEDDLVIATGGRGKKIQYVF